MEDISAIFEDILSSDEKKEQLKSIANMLGIDTDAQFDMSSISNLLNNTDKEKEESKDNNNTNPFGDFDFSKLLKLKSAFSQSDNSDKNIELLTALKPHLNEKNQAKIDQSIKLMKMLALVPLLKELGIFGGDIL